MTIATIGIDLAKNVFQVPGVDERGHVVLRKQIKRNPLAVFMVTLPSCVVGMEACGSAHHWWPEVSGIRTYGQAHVAAVREALREEQ